MGPLNDIANEKLCREMPNEFEVAGKLAQIYLKKNHQ